MNSVPEPLSDTARRRIVSGWASVIGVPAQDIRKDEWVFVERADLEAVVVVGVEGYGLAAAPPEHVELLRHAPPESLLDAVALARMLPAGADPIGSADLLFADSSPRLTRIGACVSGPEDMATLRSQVSASEWQESGIEETERQWIAVAPAGSPAAVAGFKRWRSELAQMAVLASPAHRGAGFAYATAAVATQEAVGVGLIAQWRSRQGNEASRRLAQRLGFTQLGVQVAVTLKG